MKNALILTAALLIPGFIGLRFVLTLVEHAVRF